MRRYRTRDVKRPLSPYVGDHIYLAQMAAKVFGAVGKVADLFIQGFGHTLRAINLNAECIRRLSWLILPPLHHCGR